MTAGENRKGVTAMVGASGAYVTSDFLFQTIAGNLPLPQFLILRTIIIAIFIYALARRSGKPFPKERRTRILMVLRGFAELYIILAFLTCLRHLNLQEATAINQTVPLVMTLAAYFVFGERFGLWRFLAIIIGFIGVMLIIKPGFSSFNPYYLLNFTVVIGITIRDLISKAMPSDVASSWVALVAMLMVLLASSVFSIFVDWQPVSFHEGNIIMLMALLIALGQLFAITAMRHGEVNIVAPFRYSAILFALVYDLVIFSLKPDLLSILGCLLVTFAGVVTLRRGNRKVAKVSTPS